MRRTIATILIGFMAGFAGAYFFTVTMNNPLNNEITGVPVINTSNEYPYNPARTDIQAVMTEDFVEASKKSTQSVVYIKNISELA